MYKLIVFDCDGTLVDASIMISLLHHGYHIMYPQREKLPYEYFIPCYFYTDKETRKYLHVDEEDKEQFIRTCFGENGEAMDQVLAFDGIEEVILTLKKKGFILAVNTSRSQETWGMIRKQISEEAFEAFRYQATNDVIDHVKPAPDSLYYISKQSGIDMKDILFIGDSMSDALCAQHAHCDFAYAKWGEVRPQKVPCKYVLDSPYELLDLVKKDS